MGVVYRGRQLSLNRNVAIKVLPRQLATDEEFVRRFLQEAEVIAHLDHRNIVTVHDIEQADGTYFIIMELVQGHSLRQVRRGQPMRAEEVRSVGVAVARALGYAHQKGIIHRDIKGGNVMVTDEGRIKLMDFGIAKSATSGFKTVTGSILGTPEYMAPEQARGEEVTAQSDLYSLGVMLYELASGQLPFQAAEPVALALKHITEAPVPPRQRNPMVPPWLERIILKAMEKDLGARYASAAELEKELTEAGGEQLAEVAGSSYGVPLAGLIEQARHEAATAAAHTEPVEGGPAPGEDFAPTQAPTTPYRAPQSGADLVMPPTAVAPTSAPTAGPTSPTTEVAATPLPLTPPPTPPPLAPHLTPTGPQPPPPPTPPSSRPTDAPTPPPTAQTALSTAGPGWTRLLLLATLMVIAILLFLLLRQNRETPPPMQVAEGATEESAATMPTPQPEVESAPDPELDDEVKTSTMAVEAAPPSQVLNPTQTERRRHNRQRLDQAQRELERGNYPRVIALVDQVLEDEPENEEARALRRTAVRGLGTKSPSADSATATTAAPAPPPPPAGPSAAQLWREAEQLEDEERYHSLVAKLDAVLAADASHAEAREWREKAPRWVKNQEEDLADILREHLDDLVDEIGSEDFDDIVELWGPQIDARTRAYFQRLIDTYPVLRATATLVNSRYFDLQVTFTADIVIEGKARKGSTIPFQQVGRIRWQGALDTGGKDPRFTRPFP